MHSIWHSIAMVFTQICWTGSDIITGCRNNGGRAVEAVHEEGFGESVGQSEREGAASDTVEVRDGGWEDEDVAGDRGVDGCESRENPSDRVLRLPETQEQEAHYASAPVHPLVAPLCTNFHFSQQPTLVHRFIFFLPFR